MGFCLQLGSVANGLPTGSGIATKAGLHFARENLGRCCILTALMWCDDNMLTGGGLSMFMNEG